MGTTYVLRLYVGGPGPLSASAVQLVKELCEERLDGDYRLEVIDLRHQLSRAVSDGVVAAPTLVRESPQPTKKTVGRLTRERVLAGLGLPS